MRVYIFYFLLLLIIGFWVWYFAIRIDKKKAISIIANKSNADPKKLEDFGENYLIARAKAYRNKEKSFELDGKLYSTDTGKSI